MKIRKTYKCATRDGKILNNKSDSQNDTYSCDYINNTIKDYVIEQGNMGEPYSWFVRKWKSGLVEAYYYNENVSVTPTGQEGSVYWADSGNINLPAGLFKYAPTTNISIGCGPSQLMWYSIKELNKNYISWYYVMDTNVVRSKCYVQVHCTGWSTEV